MKYSPKQITLDLQEWEEIQSELKELKRQPEDGSLTSIEVQEATGILLTRALQNPQLFNHIAGLVDLGKYKAIFASTVGAEALPTPRILIKFVRT